MRAAGHFRFVLQSSAEPWARCRRQLTFIFYAHLKNYEEFEVYTGINRFNYPIFYDYEGKCDRQNHLPDDVFYQTFLLDENNKVQLIGKPIPDSKLWELYKKIITQ